MVEIQECFIVFEFYFMIRRSVNEDKIDDNKTRVKQACKKKWRVVVSF